ncbi:unnamed protein product [Meganyctiphanes norvegica]|uniref:Uncharacterized protein n=1 Tax=Meganyctiphanes norvegica TaxID=48144 RepID=A0AAV2PWA5_MEGNR
MNNIILSCLIGVAVAAPQFQDQVIVNPNNNLQILQQNHQQDGANFQHDQETENGIRSAASGFAGSAGQSNIEGSYSYTGDDGQLVEIRYVADENGYRAEGFGIPEAPAHVAQLLAIAEEQRAQGIQFDQQGFRINK